MFQWTNKMYSNIIKFKNKIETKCIRRKQSNFVMFEIIGKLNM
jgi:hypothetical protein